MSPGRCIPHTRPPAHCPMTSLSLLAQPHHPHHLLLPALRLIPRPSLFLFQLTSHPPS